MSKSKSKVASDIEADVNIVEVKAPFKLYKDDKRRYIRLEISNPADYSVFKDRCGGFWPKGDGPSYKGSILNISAGGALIISEIPFEEGTLLLLKMTLQEVEIIDNVIGIVKRAESDQGEWLIGVEFISRECLADYLTAAECDVISDDVASFDEQLRSALNKYVYYKRVSNENK
jgi:hypothetical protein